MAFSAALLSMRSDLSTFQQMLLAQSGDVGGGGSAGGRDDLDGRAPVVRQQLRQVAILERGQTLEDVLEIVGPAKFKPPRRAAVT